MNNLTNIFRKTVSLFTETLVLRRKGSAIVETLMIIIICVAVCAIFKSNLSGLFNTVWDSVTASVQSLFS